MKILIENSKYSDEELLRVVIDKFGITNEPYKGPSFILPNGMFLDLRQYKSHSDVEKYLIDNGYSDYEYNQSTGSPTLRDLGCVRVDTPKYYITLPSRITGEQLNTLLVWIDYLSRFVKQVEVIGNGQHLLYHLDDEIISDYIVDRIKRYYTTGQLLEDKQIASQHQFNSPYKRMPVGEIIQLKERI